MDTQSPATLDEFLGTSPRRAGRRWFAAALVVLALLLAGLAIYRIATGKKQSAFQTETVSQGNLSVTVSATGKLAPTNQVTVGSELSGLIRKVVVDVNDRVTAGQPLALIDPSTFQDAVRRSEAALNAAQAAVAQAQATLQQDRAQLGRLQEVSRLSGGRVPAKTELDTAVATVARDQASLRSAQANVVSAKADLSSNKTQLTKTVIRSSVNGVVLARQVEPGQTVAASFSTPTLFVIAQDLAQMKLPVAIDEADVGEVKEGQKATFTVDAFPGETFNARITRVDLGSNQTVSSASSTSSSSTTSSTSSSTVVSYSANLSVDNPDLKLRPGMTATATIMVDQRQRALLVPNAALRFTPSTGAAKKGGVQIGMGPPRRQGQQEQQKTIGAGSRQTVYVVGKDGQPQAISVVTGQTDGSRTEVQSGQLKPGMQVIVGNRATTNG